ncbi:Hypothetical predicted protein [Mytilus galloprovincialis]|uniref:Uncharacterized protein n=1 Tax=Mytilus galloprovincialis TaxID=29158 RepID=A0A8B6EVZ6_MYTGA|nr:Hypothetical predicted protein [Mytilus galloprovincialis]
MIILVSLFVLYSFGIVDCFVKVENYQDSVYIKKGYSSRGKFYSALDITVFEPRNYDFMSDIIWSRVDGVNKKGHLVRFFKHMYDNKELVPILQYYFTNDEYYQNISKTIIEEMTYRPVFHVKL